MLRAPTAVFLFSALSDVSIAPTPMVPAHFNVSVNDPRGAPLPNLGQPVCSLRRPGEYGEESSYGMYDPPEPQIMEERKEPTAEQLEKIH